MSVWVCVPSKRPAEHVKLWAEAWRDMGYDVKLWRDEGPISYGAIWNAGAGVFVGPYPGYAKATNLLISMAVSEGARWCVIGGDDVFPDTTKRAEEIAGACEHYFSRRNERKFKTFNPCTFGVMQPTGDRWGDTEQSRDLYGANRGAYIDRIAGSAWIGREFALRAYGGNGPLWPEYLHMFPDEELQCVAEKLGVFWQRPDLTQRHEHWARKPGVSIEDMPEFLAEANSREHWDKYKALFEARKAAGFPGHEVKA